jgi:hypothetical protein
LDISPKDLHSLQTFLDRDFQNFWDIRRFGAHVGLRIKCPACPWEPGLKQGRSEDIIWYGYRKWRALANHMVTEHCSKQALQYRRIAAREGRLKKLSIQRSKRAA